jgi:four helix bundle protein
MPLPHHNLVVWQRADDLFIEIHQLTHKTFPREEKYELSSQLRRAAYSVPANIVEGTQREHPKESLHFCSIASASLAEVGYGLHAAGRLGYLLPTEYEDLEKKIRLIAAPLRGLMARFRRGSTLAPPAAKRPPTPRTK